MNDDLFLIDTNILVYAFDNTEKIKQRVALGILNECFDGKKIYALSSQNLAEFFVVITKKIGAPIPIENAKNIILKIIEFNGFKKLNYDQGTIIKSMSLLERLNLKFWDSLIIATMLENSVFNIYTENEKDFNKVKNINVINPFK